MEVGTDIIEIFRIKDAIEDSGELFLNRIYTLKEQQYCESKHQAKYQHYAGRFAAKEAIFKTLDTKTKQSITWTDIEIINDEFGKPYATVYYKGNKLLNFSVSISHCKEYATAVALKY